MKSENVVGMVILVTIVGISGRYMLPEVARYLESSTTKPIKCRKIISSNGSNEYCLNEELLAPLECYYEKFEDPSCSELRHLENTNRINGFLADVDPGRRPIKCKTVGGVSGLDTLVCLDEKYRIPLDCIFSDQESTSCEVQKELDRENKLKGFNHDHNS